MALDFDPATRLPAVRAAISMLVRATRQTFPDTNKNISTVLADYDDEKLWYTMAEMIVRSQLVVND
jgi:hypothetical protein